MKAVEAVFAAVVVGEKERRVELLATASLLAVKAVRAVVVVTVAEAAEAVEAVFAAAVVGQKEGRVELLATVVATVVGAGEEI